MFGTLPVASANTVSGGIALVHAAQPAPCGGSVAAAAPTHIRVESCLLQTSCTSLTCRLLSIWWGQQLVAAWQLVTVLSAVAARPVLLDSCAVWAPPERLVTAACGAALSL